MNLQTAQQLAGDSGRIKSLPEARLVLETLFGNRTALAKTQPACWREYHRLTLIDPASARAYYTANEKQLRAL